MVCDDLQAEFMDQSSRSRMIQHAAAKKKLMYDSKYDMIGFLILLRRIPSAVHCFPLTEYLNDMGYSMTRSYCTQLDACHNTSLPLIKSSANTVGIEIIFIWSFSEQVLYHH